MNDEDPVIDKTGWSCSMWQAHLTGIPDFEDRKRIVEEELPVEFRERVITHLKTVLRLMSARSSSE